MSKKNRPKRHHYVQKAHLNRWADDSGDIYICDLSNGKIYKGPAKSAAWEKYYYRVTQLESEFEIEEFLGSEIEGPTKIIVEKLLNEELLSIEEREQLSLYIAFQKTRVPHFEILTNDVAVKQDREALLKNLKDDQIYKEMMNELKPKWQSIMTEIPSRDELIKTLEEDRIKIEYPREHSIKMMFLLAIPLADLFTESNWTLLNASESSYIISDNPVVTMSMGGKTGNVIATETTFPLSPNSMLLINHDGERRTAVTDENINGVKELNRRTTLHATRYIFGSDPNILRENYEELQRLKDVKDQIGTTQFSGQSVRTGEPIFIRRIPNE